MPLYIDLASLSQTAASNAADGAADAPSTIDQQLNLLAAFIAQLRDGSGFTAQLGARNRIINGNFAVNQRVVSGTVSLAAGIYGHDRWKAGAAGCTYTFTTSGLDTTITISAGSLLQVIEGLNVEGGTYTMSWAGTAQGKINGGAFATTGVQATGVTAGANFSAEFGIGSISKVQVECNGTASQFERRPLGYELFLCQRYFQTSYDLVAPGTSSAANNRLVVLSYAATTPGLQFIKNFPVHMRIAPAISFYNPNTGAAGSARNESIGSDIAVSTFGTPGVEGFSAYNYLTASAVTNIYSLHYTASAEL